MAVDIYFVEGKDVTSILRLPLPITPLMVSIGQYKLLGLAIPFFEYSL